MRTFSALLMLSVSAVAMAAPAAGGYRLLQTIPVAGDDGWDHPTVDSAGRRLYVTHGTRVAVIDVDSGKLVGKIDNTVGVHFTVIDPELDRGFISNGGAARLTIFNTKTLATIMDESRATLVWAICPRGKRSGARSTAQSFANILAASLPVTTKQQWLPNRNGAPVAWWYFQEGKLQIRCYAPGGGV
jgi:hypothetical protein